MCHVDQTSKERSWPWKQSQLNSSCAWGHSHTSLCTTGALTLQEFPFLFCLNPAGSAWFQLQEISSSLSPHLGSGHLTDGTTWMMSTFFHLLLLVSVSPKHCPSLSLWHTRTIPCVLVLSHLYIFSYYLSCSLEQELWVHTPSTQRHPSDCWASLCCYYYFY